MIEKTTISPFKINRKFTQSNVDVYQNINFIQWNSRMITENGKCIENQTVIAPSFWSQLSVDILAQKYLRRAGIPKILKKVPEDNLPEWLYRSTEDTQALLKLPQDERYIQENDIRMVLRRIIGAWTYWGMKGQYFESEMDAKTFYDEMTYIMIMQKAAPNSPQFFNTGIHWAYGIEGNSPGYYYDDIIKQVRLARSSYERPQIHACFIQTVEDNLIDDQGILDLASRESRVFKFGSGSGTNFSPLRGKNEALSGGGKSSGLMSFLKIGDTVAGAIKSGGLTRRAAKMVTLDADHPDILEYVSWKTLEENKVVSLITGSKIVNNILSKIVEAYKKNNKVEDNLELIEILQEAYNSSIPIGYISRVIGMLNQGITEFDWEVFTSDFNGEAYATVSGQNSNNSVRLSDEFMRAVIADSDFYLKYRTSEELVPIRARIIWDKLCFAAWSSADPGVQFDTTINAWHTCPNSGRIYASNPCSEYMFLNDTACNLASLNLVTFEEGPDNFDQEGFAHTARLLALTLEISVYMAQYPSSKIAELSYKFRTLGLGYANLGALLMRRGLPYDSQEGRAWAAYITALMHGVAYEASADLAQLMGAFDGYSVNSEPMLRVIKNHQAVLLNQQVPEVEIQPFRLDRALLSTNQLAYLDALWDRVVQKGTRYGYRNAQVTVLAPTGTIGLFMDCDTTGIEPDYSLVKHKKLAGGGYMKIVNGSVKKALQHLNYEPNQIDEIIQYIIGTGSTDKCGTINRQALLSKGLTEDEINKGNEALKSAFSISNAFSVWTLGVETFKRLNIPESKIYDPNFNLFRFFGFSQNDIQAATLIACGHMCIEGAPYLKDKDLAVFDCADKNGEHGKRYISVDGHILMMAAVQPFLSGAISKTVNMPSEATIADCSYVYQKGWELGVKAIALFRSNSKLSSVYGSSNNKLLDLLSNPEKKILVRGQREVLPERRKAYIQRIQLGKDVIYYTLGINRDGEVREVLINGCDNEGSPMRSLLNCTARTISLALQHGTPLRIIVDSFLGSNFEPNGIVQGDQSIKFAQSPLDYLARFLGINFCNMPELGHVNANQALEVVDYTDPVLTQTNEDNNNKDQCFVCGTVGKMRRAGACFTCESCGSSTGCG